MSVLALEEFSKAKWIDHYYYSAITNTGLPDVEFEQSWLKLLYLHPEKQLAFISQDLFEYPPKLIHFIKTKQLEKKKQQAVYVGLERIGSAINTNSRISIPTRIKETDAKQFISWVNYEFIFIKKMISESGVYFGIYELDGLLLSDEYSFIHSWPFKSRVRSRKHLKAHL
jgi:hypothetical protein